MVDELTAYQLAVSLFEGDGIPSFPVLLTQDEQGKWGKKPLVKWGSTTPETDPGAWNWRRANAVGVPTGGRSGLFVFDVDDYKPGSDAARWVEKQKLPPTRTHRTASGGTHLIYRMPEGLRLGNHAPKVSGLDVRGDGGFIVWGDAKGLYSVVVDRPPAAMPQRIIDLLNDLNRGAGRVVSDDEVPPIDWRVNEDTAVAKLHALLSDPLKNRALVSRFLRGSTVGLKDRSRSSMDMSVAGMLARAGFSYNEIVLILLRHFEHGKAGRDGWTDAVEREVCRCAYKATAQYEQARDMIRQQLEASISGLSQRLARPQDAKDRA